jgi:hypothetical protein
VSGPLPQRGSQRRPLIVQERQRILLDQILGFSDNHPITKN